MSNTGKTWGVAMLLGVGIGLAIGYLTAPRKGAETRELIKEKMTDFKNKAQETVSKMKGATVGGDGSEEE